jgi:hypothetical protein
MMLASLPRLEIPQIDFGDLDVGMTEQAREAVDLATVFDPHARERVPESMRRDAHTLDIGLVADAIQHLVYPAGGQLLAPPAQEDMALRGIGGLAVELGVLPERRPIPASWALSKMSSPASAMS